MSFRFILGGSWVQLCVGSRDRFCRGNPWSFFFKETNGPPPYLKNMDFDQNVSFDDFSLIFIVCFRTPNFIIDGCICKNVFLKFQFERKSLCYFNDVACLPELKK